MLQEPFGKEEKNTKSIGGIRLREKFQVSVVEGKYFRNWTILFYVELIAEKRNISTIE